MTFKNWLLDVWLTILYGKWKVKRSRVDLLRHDRRAYDYYAYCWRSSDLILCSDKREAESVIAYQNDLRGK